MEFDARDDMGAPAYVPRLIVTLWEHRDPDLGLETVVWCQGNVDGSYYVDWGRAHLIANDTRSAPLQLLMMQMHARLLIAARGQFREVSLEEADQIAIAAYRTHHIGETIQ